MRRRGRVGGRGEGVGVEEVKVEGEVARGKEGERRMVRYERDLLEIEYMCCKYILDLIIWQYQFSLFFFFFVNVTSLAILLSFPVEATQPINLS